ncbi:hypothetical protein D3C81_1924950 [compost metagenome]
MIQARIRMVRTPDHQNGEAVVPLDLLQDHASLLLHFRIKQVHRLPGLLYGEVAFILGNR